MIWAGRYGKNEDIEPNAGPRFLDSNWRFLSPATGIGYLQRLDMRTGVLTTTWAQGSMSIETESVVGSYGPAAGQKWVFRSKEPLRLNLKMPPVRPQAVSVSGLTEQGGVYVSNPNTTVCSIEEAWSLDPTIIPTFQSIEAGAAAIWRKRWETDIELDGPAEDQQAIHSWMYYLDSCGGGGPANISPYGLSSASYHGHVFWDADVWLFPALALTDPASARAIPDYRLEHVPQAEAAAKGRGIRFPWQSALSGDELATGTFNDEIHVTGDVAFMLDQAAALGLAEPVKAQNVVNQAASFFYDRSTLSGLKRAILHVRSPDENRSYVDDDLYTNCLAQWANNHSAMPKPIDYELPRDSQGLLTYDGDKVTGYKQAAAILTLYPLQDSRALAQERIMMGRFPNKTTPFGPAMSRSIESIVWSRMGNAAEAYRAWKLSWMPYCGHPFLLFAEKPSASDTYFQTGAAGCLQSVVYGFLGFGIDSQQKRQADWTLKLNNSHWLNIHPNLPNAWKSVQFRNFTVLGKRYTLTVMPGRTTVTEGEP